MVRNLFHFSSEFNFGLCQLKLRATLDRFDGGTDSLGVASGRIIEMLVKQATLSDNAHGGMLVPLVSRLSPNQALRVSDHTGDISERTCAEIPSFMNKQLLCCWQIYLKGKST